MTLPYTSVQAFAVRSAGSMDKDSELELWTEISPPPPPPPGGSDESEQTPQPGMSYFCQDLRKDTDLMAIHRYLSFRVLGRCADSAASADASELLAPGPPGAVESLMNWLGDDAQQIDPRTVEEKLWDLGQMLMSGEKVCLAFKVGRDMFVYTSMRVFVMDAQGWTGKRVQYLSLPFRCVCSWSVTSAGTFDTDSELKLHLRTPWAPEFKQDFRKGKADIVAIHRFLSAQVLGSPGTTASSPVRTQGSVAGADDSGANLSGFLSWVGDDGRQVNPEEVDKQLHTNPVILQADEPVSLAFKCGRDLCVFTNKRCLLVDVQGWTGKRVEYATAPYSHCPAFSFTTPGALLDTDAELVLFTDCPGKARLGVDLRKGKVDYAAVQAGLRALVL